MMERQLPRLGFLDGLRAVAVLSVVGFHVGIPGFSGGFVGVDVFFVLSGYLIIGQILTELAGGRFSYLNFYARRALRILPPFIIVLLASVAIASVVLLSPNEIRSFSRELAASATMTSNHLYLSQQGYFDGASDLKPLLNMWSLAVEEQFYLVAPAVLGLLGLFTARGFGRVAWALAGLLMVASLVAAVLGSWGERNYGFYLAACRAWEFAAGGVVAITQVRLVQTMRSEWPRWWVEVVGAAGLALVIAPVLLLTESVAYPSWFAVLPVVGTMIVIAACLAAPQGFLARALSLRPACYIGLISYSLYLWHWPLLTFGRIARMGERDLVLDLCLAALAALLAVATYETVEAPIRRHRMRLVALLRPSALVAAVALACVVPVGLAKAGVKLWIPAVDVSESDKSAVQAALKRDPCVATSHGLREECLEKLKRTARWGILMGDSFARTSYPRLKELADANGVGLVTVYETGCRPLLKTLMLKRRGNRCSSVFDETIAALASLPNVPDFVVLRAHWHAELRVFRNETAELEAARVGAELRSTLLALSAHGVKRILVVGTQPNHQKPPSCLIRVASLGRSPTVCERSASAVKAQEAAFVAAIDAAAEGLPRVRIVHPTTALCTQATCLFSVGEKAAYSDSMHLSQAGEGVLFDAFENNFRWIFSGTTAAARTPIRAPSNAHPPNGSDANL